MASSSPAEWADTLRERVDRDRVLVGWLVPGAAAVGMMAVGFVLVAVVLLTNEPFITGALWTELLALATMLLFPHLVAGLWFGRRHGQAVAPPVAAGLAPLVVLVVSLAVHGGPVLTPFLVPLVALGAVGVWTITFAAGMVAGARLTGAS
jgi:hypothetical protein